MMKRQLGQSTPTYSSFWSPPSPSYPPPTTHRLSGDGGCNSPTKLPCIVAALRHSILLQWPNCLSQPTHLQYEVSPPIKLRPVWDLLRCFPLSGFPEQRSLFRRLNIYLIPFYPSDMLRLHRYTRTWLSWLLD